MWIDILVALIALAPLLAKTHSLVPALHTRR